MASKKTKETIECYELSENARVDLLRSSKGKMMFIRFVKADGTERSLVGRTGVKKHHRGGENTTKDRSYIVKVFEPGVGYRNINVLNLLEARISGKRYVFSLDVLDEAYELHKKVMAGGFHRDGNCILWVNDERFKMSVIGGGRQTSHSISVSDSGPDRLMSHWDGFTRQYNK